MKAKWFLMALKFITGLVLYFMVIAWVIMKIWNGLVPGITGWQMLSYYQALVLLVLVRLMTGLKIMGGGYMKNHFKQRWTGMSEEEREAMREKFRAKWCNKQ